MKPGRIETYVHSDMTTPNKGVGVVKIYTETDFSTKDPIFLDFCKKAAQVAFITGALQPTDLVQFDDEYCIEKLRVEVSAYLGEDVYIGEVWSTAL